MARKNHNNPAYGNAQAERAKTLKQREEFFRDAYRAISRHPMFAPMDYYVHVAKPEELRHRGWAIISDQGRLYYNPAIEATREEWEYVIAHCLLHLGLGHFQGRRYPAAWNAACDVIVGRFLARFKLGEHPLGLPEPDIGSGQTEETLYERFCREGVPDRWMAYGTGEEGKPDMLWEDKSWQTRDNKPIDWPRLFAAGMRGAVASAVEVAGGERKSIYDYPTHSRTQAQAARDWCVNRFPLLGALASAFTVIEDPALCRRAEISVAAIDPAAREIYFNPAAGLDEEEYRFVMAHELLHVGLRHHVRQEGRDHYLWNIACDYVINAWLIEMGIGVMPQFGAMYDPKLKNLSAEAIYDQIVNDLRALQRACTLRGKGKGDILERASGEWWRSRDGTSLDDFYRRCLSQGLTYHEQTGRGYLPAGLVEEIRAMSQPPIPWDVELAEWFEAHFAPVEKIRSYAQPSRRQSSTPDIPRPRWVDKPDAKDGRTFGVVLDTSGSMDRHLLAKALGAIASYSLAHEVPAARVVFCDATTYDQGYMPPEDIGGNVKVRGRGGTILQPGIDLLESAEDFPKEGPILVITDTYCDHVHVHREHAYLIPDGSRLPFPPRGEVFRIK